MRGTTIPITIVLALTFAMLPLGSADWGSRGSFEPDTSYDRSGGFMFANPDTTTGGSGKVYFNAWASQGPVGVAATGTSINPNSVAAQTTVLMAPHRPMAILGIWKDCNKDGYMGMSENALYDYPSALLGDTSVCPPTPGDNLAHNDGEMVREVIPIGPDANFGTPEDANVHNFPDDSVLWADFKRPGDAPDQSCPLTPIPAGTLDTTGGMLRYVDCIDNWRITGTFNAAAHAACAVACPLGFGVDQYAFDDADYTRPDQSASPLNTENPYGQPGGSPAVSVWDCDADPILVNDPTGLSREISDPTGGEANAIFGDDDKLVVNASDENHDIYVAGAPRGVPSINPDGSVAAAVNETEDGLYDCDTADDAPGTVETNGDIYFVQAQNNGQVAREGRAVVDNRLFFDESDATGLSVDGQTVIPTTQNPTVFLGLPNRFEGFWVGQTSYLASRNPLVNIDTFAPKVVFYITHYVQLGANATSQLTLPSNTVGSYGQEWCDRGPDPAKNGGLVCDPDAWVADADGDGETDDEPKPGWAYHLRDIDCYDTSAAGARDAGVHWGVVTGTQCE